jgi:heme exporter protein B
LTSLAQSLAVARKDLAIEFRTKESLNSAAAFSIVILVLFSFAFDPTSEETRTIAGGLLWLCFAFAGALIFNRGFARELPNECLDALLASPLSAGSLVVGKAMTSAVLLLVVEAVSLFVFGFFYNLRWWVKPLELISVFALATWGVSIVGSVFGALTVNLRLRELMLPVVIYPLLIPLLIAAIELTNLALGTQAVGGSDYLWARVLIVFDVIFTSLAIALAETILVN